MYRDGRPRTLVSGQGSFKDGLMLKGNLDRIEYRFGRGWVLVGWALDLACPERPLHVQATEGSKILGSGLANGFRLDLLDAGISDGRGAIDLPLAPGVVEDRCCHVIGLEILPDCGGIIGPTPFRVEPIIGNVDKIEGIVVSGWASDTSDLARIVIVELLIDNEVIATVPATLFRRDLVAAGHGSGYCGFQWMIPEEYCDGHRHSIAARLANIGTVISSAVPEFQISRSRLSSASRRLLYDRHVQQARLAELEQALWAEARQLRRPTVPVNSLKFDRVTPMPWAMP